MKFVAVIVAFNPDSIDLKRNILLMIGGIDKIIIFQNSLIDIYYLLGLDNQDPINNKIVLLGNGNNIGIASALNQSAKWALDNNYDYILSLDQDSYFLEEDLIKYKELVIEYSCQNDDCGVFGPNIDNRGNLLYAKSNKCIDVMETITSGSIYPIKIFKNDNFFEDKLFIDAVDYEFCYRLRVKHNLKTIVFPSIVLHHEVGEALKTFWGFKTDNYSAFRTYYIVRNQLIIWRRYPNLFSNLYKKKYLKIHIFNRIIKIVLGEEHKYLKIKSIFVGILHGLKGKLGYYKIS